MIRLVRCFITANLKFFVSSQEGKSKIVNASTETKRFQAKLNKAESNMYTFKDTLSVLKVKTLEKGTVCPKFT